MLQISSHSLGLSGKVPVTAFSKLFDFIENKMRMSHIYQPVMLMKLLERQGKASRREIAEALLRRDESQIEYYEHIVRGMVGRVLTKREIVSKERAVYSLHGFSELTVSDREKLVELCENKLRAFLTTRNDPWSHRKQTSGYVSGTRRYQVLKRASFRCELCGISADVKALEVDHIVPRSKGGTDDLSNLQALCYSCNAMKSNRDDTDFRVMASSYEHRESGCVFCDPTVRVTAENELAVAIRDGYPVTPLHTLVIPKRHVSDYFQLHQPEKNAIDRLLHECKYAIEDEDAAVSGFNVGMNSGEDAGQTIWHTHIHLIPRRKGDVDNPKGGVRGCIPSRQSYSAPSE